METLSRNLFEDPTAVCLIAIAVAVLAATAFFFNRRRWMLVVAGAAVVVVPVALVLDALVVTDREQILDATDAIAQEFEAGRIDTLRDVVSEQYKGFSDSREHLLRRAERAIVEHGVGRVVPTDAKLTVHGPHAELSVVTLVDGKAITGAERTPLAWDITWRRIGDRWQIVRVSEPRIVVPGFRRR